MDNYRQREASKPRRLISKLSAETIARIQERSGRRMRAEFIREAIDEKFGRVTPPESADVQTIKARVDALSLERDGRDHSS